MKRECAIGVAECGPANGTRRMAEPVPPRQAAPVEDVLMFDFGDFVKAELLKFKWRYFFE
jgi:hypothetical protein